MKTYLKFSFLASAAIACIFPLSQAVSQTVEPNLDDLFRGKAQFQTITQSVKVSFVFTTPGVSTFGTKVSAIQLSEAERVKFGGYKFMAFVRGIYANPYFEGKKPGETWSEKYNIFAMGSNDGITFKQVGEALFHELRVDHTFYDPHIAVDESVNPRKFIITMECAEWMKYGASVCVSESTSPWLRTSWSRPNLVVSMNYRDGMKSASTGVTLVDKGNYFVKWTLLDDGMKDAGADPFNANPDEGFESASSWATVTTNLKTYLGKSGSAGVRVLGAEKNVYCNNAWDCNNRDIQDWKKIGDHYYAIYNGANYYRCVRPKADSSQGKLSKWSLAIRRSTQALGLYTESSGIIMTSERTDICGISYPFVAVLDGVTYMYYDHYPLSGAKVNSTETKRSKLVWKATQGARHERLSAAPNFRGRVVTFLQSFVGKHYQAYLNRTASAGDIETWVQASIKEVDFGISLARGFFYSTEFQNRLGTMSRSAAISQLYRAVMFREPDAEGLNNFVSSTLTYAEIFEYMLTSAEFKARNVYRQVLARELDPEGFNNVIAYLNSGGSLETLRGFMFDSPEGQDVFAETFSEIMFRSAQASEVSWGRGVIAGGNSIAKARQLLIALPEAQARLEQIIVNSIPAFSYQGKMPSLLQLYTPAGDLATFHKSVLDTELKRTMIGAVNNLDIDSKKQQYVWGWTCLPKHQGPIKVQALINGTVVASGLTQLAVFNTETGILNACEGGKFVNHRFKLDLPLAQLVKFPDAVPVTVRVIHPFSGGLMTLTSPNKLITKPLPAGSR